MIFSITANQSLADLGYLLNKDPSKLHNTPLSYGDAYLFFADIGDKRSTATLLLDINPLALVRKNDSHGSAFALEEYVNDRPYVASSFMSIAINRILGSALSGKSKLKQELSETSIELKMSISALPSRGGKELLYKLFEPLGYDINVKGHVLDNKFPEWGDSTYFTITLERKCLLSEFLTHLYILIPVLDNKKHYWIDEEEIEKLLRFGEGWLASHPEKNLITRRYLKNFKSYSNEALDRLSEGSSIENSSEADESIIAELEGILEGKINLNQERIEWVSEKIKALGALKILDLGCGEGNLLSHLMKDSFFKHITGADVSIHSLSRARKKLNIDNLPSFQKNRINLIQAALTYRDQRLAGYDAATLIEVIEHVDFPRLDALKRVVFEFAKPSFVIITTPNAEYNSLFENLPVGQFRHHDHRFEWTREEFRIWAEDIAKNFGYYVTFEDIGTKHEILGSPTQAGVFTKK